MRRLVCHEAKRTHFCVAFITSRAFITIVLLLAWIVWNTIPEQLVLCIFAVGSGALLSLIIRLLTYTVFIAFLFRTRVYLKTNPTPNASSKNKCCSLYWRYISFELRQTFKHMGSLHFSNKCVKPLSHKINHYFLQWDDWYVMRPKGHILVLCS